MIARHNSLRCGARSDPGIRRRRSARATRREARIEVKRYHARCRGLAAIMAQVTILRRSLRYPKNLGEYILESVNADGRGIIASRISYISPVFFAQDALSCTSGRICQVAGDNWDISFVANRTPQLSALDMRTMISAMTSPMPDDHLTAFRKHQPRSSGSS